MMWLVWQMWVLLLLAAIVGGIAGWILRAHEVKVPLRLPGRASPSPASDPVPGRPMRDNSATPEKQGEKPVSGGAKTPVSGGENLSSAGSKPVPSKTATADDLSRIKGLGPKAVEALKAEGVTQFAQIAAWKKDDINRFDAALNARGRIAREDWVGQAKTLAAE